MKKTLLTIAVVLISKFVFAQYNETIRTARPGQAVGPFTTGKYVFQIQTGFTYGNFNGVSRSGENVEYGASLRYGISERVEVRSAFRLRSDNVEVSEVMNSQFGGLSFWNVGLRVNILNGKGSGPSLGVQTDVRLTTVNKNYKTEHVAPRLMLIYAQKLSNTFKITANMGVSGNGNNATPVGSYVINISFPLGNKLGGFVENYGGIFEKDFDNRWDTGISYLVNNNFQLDLSTGYGKNEGQSDWFIDGGVSWRFKLKENNQ